MKDRSYEAVMARKNEIMKKAIGIDYSVFEKDGLGFDYAGLMASVPYEIEEISEIARKHKVGNTPLLYLENITKQVRKHTDEGMGAQIYIKDEACNASGSFKARRASLSVYQAKKLGYQGVIAVTSGNYGAAVASQAAMYGLKCVIVQEVFDSKKVGQPEIIEKARKCEAFGAEVIQLSVGPELFYTFLRLLEETGYYNASLYTPFAIAGIEPLGYEIAKQSLKEFGKFPDVVIATHAGGGNLTGTARGLLKAGAHQTKVIGASVEVRGLHMASDHDFNRKSFTTGHTGFGVPFATMPDRSDVPRNAARVLRYMDAYYTITQGEVFYVTELLARLEGLERGPAGNVSLAVAISIARTMREDQIIVVQETEYTGAGKHPTAQLNFAKENGIRISYGNPRSSIAGSSIVLPETFDQVQAKEESMDSLRKSYLKKLGVPMKYEDLNAKDQEYLQRELKCNHNELRSLMEG